METHNHESADTLAGVYDSLRAQPASGEIEALVKELGI